MIKKEINNQIAILTLDRLDKYHSFVKEMALYLQLKLDECGKYENIRCILITATGVAFCAGQDLSEANDENSPGLEKIVKEHYNPIIRKIRSIEKPTIKVNGVAAGAGASIALCCDIVATKSAVFVQAFSKIGLIPDSAGNFSFLDLLDYKKLLD